MVKISPVTTNANACVVGLVNVPAATFTVYDPAVGLLIIIFSTLFKLSQNINNYQYLFTCQLLIIHLDNMLLNHMLLSNPNHEAIVLLQKLFYYLLFVYSNTC